MQLREISTRRLSKSLLALTASGTLVFTAACSNDNGQSAASSSPQKESTIITIAASTSIWGDVAQAVTSDKNVEVTPIITGSKVDPHDFEPSAADLAKVREADIAVVGGGGYDAWMYKDLDQSKVISALPLTEHDHDHDHADADDHDHDHMDADHDHDHADADDHDHDHDDHHHGEVNEHIWYDTDAVEKVADALTDRLKEAGVEADDSEFKSQLDAIKDRIEKLPNVRVAQTEPIASYLIEDSKMKDVTPKGYQQSALNESEPSAADANAFLELIRSKGVDVLIFNPQTETDLTKQLRQAAEDANIPVVNISETPDEQQTYLQLITDAVSGLEQATSK